MLFGLFSGFFLAALHKSEGPAPSEPDQTVLPVGIRIVPETETNRAPEVVIHPHQEQEEAAVVLTENLEEPVTAETGSSVSGPVAEQASSSISQKLVDQEGIDRILETADFQIYSSAKEDTLWRIAEKCYGSGYYFPVLIECNPFLNIYEMEEGTKVRICKDLSVAQRLYHKITRIDGEEVFYYYRVVEGDTFPSVAMKFYKEEGAAKRFKEDYPFDELVPGARIRIVLH